MSKIAVITDVHLGQRGIAQAPLGSAAAADDEAEEFRQESLLAMPRPDGRGVRRAGWLLEQLQALSRAGSAEPEPVHLIVTGDLLDLSLACMDEAVADLGHLLRVLEPVHEVTYVVGNHDHHLWMLHGERSRVLAPLEQGRLPESHPYQPTAREEPEPATWLEPYLEKAAGRPVKLRLAYPSYQLWLDDLDETGAPGRTRVYFTHGHLFGGLYTFMAELLADHLVGKDDPERVAATVNAPVIELIYWLLGETGEGMGADGVLERLYTDLQLGNQSLIDQLLGKLIERLLPEGIVRGIPDRVERALVTRLARAVVRHAVDDSTPLAGQSSDRFLPEELTRRALDGWVRKVGLPAEERMLLFHGHTHRADRHRVAGTHVHAFNLGSWLLEPGAGPPHAYLVTLRSSPGQPIDVQCSYGGSDRGETPDNLPVMTRPWSWNESDEAGDGTAAAEGSAA